MKCSSVLALDKPKRFVAVLPFPNVSVYMAPPHSAKNEAAENCADPDCVFFGKDA